MGAQEYLHGKKRWCLWLDGASPAELRKCSKVLNRVAKCKKSRENSVAAGIRKFAETPFLFAQRTQPTGRPFIIIPRVSSESKVREKMNRATWNEKAEKAKEYRHYKALHRLLLKVERMKSSCVHNADSKKRKRLKTKRCSQHGSYRCFRKFCAGAHHHWSLNTR